MKGVRPLNGVWGFAGRRRGKCGIMSRRAQSSFRQSVEAVTLTLIMLIVMLCAAPEGKSNVQQAVATDSGSQLHTR